MHLSREVLSWLASDAGERAIATVDPDDALASQRLLRREHDAERAGGAIEIAQARTRAERKFPGLAGHLLADRTGIEQATSLRVARYKAARLASTGTPLCDLGSGIGADAIALREHEGDVVAIDRDPARAFMTAHNARVSTAVADAAHVAVHGSTIHLDPARRAEGKRVWRLEDLAPSPDVVQRRLAESHAGVIKLGPGADLGSLPFEGEREIVSEEGRLVALHVWTGAQATDLRRATLHVGDVVHTFAVPEPVTSISDERVPFSGWIHTVDPAIERAGLLPAFAAAHDLLIPHPELGLLIGPDPVRSPWLRPHEFLDAFPYQPKRFRSQLRQFEGGPIVIKTRGKAVEAPERLTAGLGNDAADADPTVLFILRDGRRRFVLVTRRPR